MKECYVVIENWSDECCTWGSVYAVATDRETAVKLKKESEESHTCVIPEDEWLDLADKIDEMIIAGEITHIEDHSILINEYLNTDYTLDDLRRAEAVYDVDAGYIDTTIQISNLYGNLD